MKQSKSLSSNVSKLTPIDITQLRKQIHAFRLVSKNMPLPPQLRQELWNSSISEEEKRLLDAPPGGLSTAAAEVVDAAHSANSQPTQPSKGSEAQQVKLVLPPLPQN
ncbi:hypothetical protein IWW42_003050, partial [Coemansia sp. RSA 1085]